MGKSSAVSVNNLAFIFQCCSVLICSYEKAHQSSKFFFKQFSAFNITDISKFVVNFNLIMMFKLKYVVILTGLFYSVMTSST